MLLSTLLQPFIKELVPDIKISGLHNDSRAIVPGDVFIAYQGATCDGRDFIFDAINKGAVAVVYDPAGFDSALIPSIIAIPFPDLSMHLSALASRFYNFPSKVLSVTGVTGTNGKTTIAYQLAQAHALMGQISRYMGTLGQGDVNHLIPLPNTTPDGLLMQRLLYGYCEEGVQQVCMEVSSHALTLNRVADVAFKQAIYTNLSHDHLDFHRNMESYAEAKAKLFAFPRLEAAIINRDDMYCEFMKESVQASGCQTLFYGIKSACDVMAQQVDVTMRGSVVPVNSPWGTATLKLNALGLFNVYNGLAVFTSLMAMGYPLSMVENVMPQLLASPGRMDLVSQEPVVLVDFAHTPDALENVLSTLTPLKQGKLHVMFGCGGDRDSEKRPLMGAVADKWADSIIITSDNPRHEAPESILDEIERGISHKKKLLRIENREQAIAKAISLCDTNDILVIAGKGHENYQQIGDKKWPFSDKEVALKYLTTTTSQA